MRFNHLALAAGMLLGSVGLAAAAPALVTADINVRSGPGVNYGIVGMLPGGSSVNVLGCSGAWCRVGGGYASRDYLDNGGGPVYGAEPVYVGPPVYYGPPVVSFGFGFGGGWGHGWRGGHHHRH